MSEPSIVDLANSFDAYSTRRKLTLPKYDAFREQLLIFAKGRLDDEHQRGVTWFIKSGLPALNRVRKAQGQDPIPCDISESVAMNWLRDNYPELREAFRK